MYIYIWFRLRHRSSMKTFSICISFFQPRNPRFSSPKYFLQMQIILKRLQKWQEVHIIYLIQGPFLSFLLGMPRLVHPCTPTTGCARAAGRPRPNQPSPLFSMWWCFFLVVHGAWSTGRKTWSTCRQPFLSRSTSLFTLVYAHLLRDPVASCAPWWDPMTIISTLMRTVPHDLRCDGCWSDG